MPVYRDVSQMDDDATALEVARWADSKSAIIPDPAARTIAARWLPMAPSPLHLPLGAIARNTFANAYTQKKLLDSIGMLPTLGVPASELDALQALEAWTRALYCCGSTDADLIAMTAAFGHDRDGHGAAMSLRRHSYSMLRTRRASVTEIAAIRGIGSKRVQLVASALDLPKGDEDISTHAAIGAPRPDDPNCWVAIYVHGDGYPSYTGELLFAQITGHFGGDLEAALTHYVAEHPAGWSVLRREFEQNVCYCHTRGEGVEVTAFETHDGAYSMPWTYLLRPKGLEIHRWNKGPVAVVAWDATDTNWDALDYATPLVLP